MNALSPGADWTTAPHPVDEAGLASIAARLALAASDVTAAGLAERTATALLGGPSDYGARALEALVPDAELGMAEKGFSLMLAAAGRSRGACRTVAAVTDWPETAGLFVPKDRAGNLAFEAGLFLVMVSATECAVFDAGGDFRGIDRASRIGAVLGRHGGGLTAVNIHDDGFAARRSPFTPLHRRRLCEVVPDDEVPQPPSESAADCLADHPGFADEHDLRTRCHVFEYDCDVPGLRLLRLVDRYDRSDAPGSVEIPSLWLLTTAADGRLSPVGVRIDPGLYVSPAWRGRGLGALLCLTGHDDPTLRAMGSPGLRTIGSHKAWRKAHRMAVARALGRGLEVPGDVLAEYPELATAAPVV